MRKSQTLFKFSLSEYFIKAKLDVNLVLAKLQRMADRVSVNQIKLSLNDSIFDITSINNFKKVATKELKTLEIALTPKVLYIKDDNEKHAILKNIMMIHYMEDIVVLKECYLK